MWTSYGDPEAAGWVFSPVSWRSVQFQQWDLGDQEAPGAEGGWGVGGSRRDEAKDRVSSAGRRLRELPYSWILEVPAPNTGSLWMDGETDRQTNVQVDIFYSCQQTLLKDQNCPAAIKHSLELRVYINPLLEIVPTNAVFLLICLIKTPVSSCFKKYVFVSLFLKI